MENEVKEKKQNWWTRKSTAGKVAFIIAAILALFSIFALIIVMDLRRYVGEDSGDLVYGPGISSGWEKFGISIANSTASWILTALIIFITFLFIFVCNFITHLFDNGSRKARTISSLIRSLVKYVSIIAAVCFVLIAWGVDVVGIVAGVGVPQLTAISDVASSGQAGYSGDRNHTTVSFRATVRTERNHSEVPTPTPAWNPIPVLPRRCLKLFMPAISISR